MDCPTSDWPVRWRAANLLHGLGEPAATATRPAPVRQPLEFFGSPALLHPQFSPHAFIETGRGIIEAELNVVDAPVTTHTFIELARSGFFNGLKVHRLVPTFVIQAGDPRGDGEGGPGYTIPDELSPLPYLRGTVGMALDWRDTGGSQWFITLSPQPHLDAKYTVFGRVVNGWDVLDRVSQWDVVERVFIWDGVELAIKKRGRRSPPFPCAGERRYRFLPPFFFPPLAAFFAMLLVPPFGLVCCRGSQLCCGVAAFRPARPVRKAPWLRSERCDAPAARRPTTHKKRVPAQVLHPGASSTDGPMTRAPIDALVGFDCRRNPLRVFV